MWTNIFRAWIGGKSIEQHLLRFPVARISLWHLSGISFVESSDLHVAHLVASDRHRLL